MLQQGKSDIIWVRVKRRTSHHEMSRTQFNQSGSCEIRRLIQLSSTDTK